MEDDDIIIFKMFRKNNCHPRIQYLAKLSHQHENKIKSVHINKDNLPLTNLHVKKKNNKAIIQEGNLTHKGVIMQEVPLVLHYHMAIHLRVDGRWIVNPLRVNLSFPVQLSAHFYQLDPDIEALCGSLFLILSQATRFPRVYFTNVYHLPSSVGKSCG